MGLRQIPILFIRLEVSFGPRSLLQRNANQTQPTSIRTPIYGRREYLRCRERSSSLQLRTRQARSRSGIHFSLLQPPPQRPVQPRLPRVPRQRMSYPPASETSTTASLSSSSQNSSPTHSTVQNGMESKTKIAICVGIGLGIPFILAVAWLISFLCLKRERDKRERGFQLAGGAGESGSMDGASDAKPAEKRHNEIVQVHELRAYGTPEVPEMDGLVTSPTSKVRVFSAHRVRRIVVMSTTSI